MRKINTLVIFIGIVILSLNSCSTSKSLPETTSNNAKNLGVIEDKSIVYIYRRSAYGWAVGLKVDINNIHLASFYPKRYYLSILEPGRYLFTGRCENTDDLILNLEAGKKYFMEVIPRSGWVTARCNLSLTDPIEGKKQVQRCKLIGLNKEAQAVLNYSADIK